MGDLLGSFSESMRVKTKHVGKTCVGLWRQSSIWKAAVTATNKFEGRPVQGLELIVLSLVLSLSFFVTVCVLVLAFLSLVLHRYHQSHDVLLLKRLLSKSQGNCSLSSSASHHIANNCSTLSFSLGAASCLPLSLYS